MRQGSAVRHGAFLDETFHFVRKAGKDARLRSRQDRDATAPAVLRSAEDLACKDIDSLERMTLVDYARVNEGSIMASRIKEAEEDHREQKSLLPDVSA